MPIADTNPDPLNLRRWIVTVERHHGGLVNRFENVWAANAYHAAQCVSTRLGIPQRPRALGGRKDGTQRNYATANGKIEVDEDFRP